MLLTNHDTVNNCHRESAKQQPPASLLSFPFGQPRSFSEAARVNDVESKLRQLPCRTFISIGACPYRDRCEFLHDPRCCSNSAEKIKTLRRKNKEDIVLDGLFWPIMPIQIVSQRLEYKTSTTGSSRPSPFQEYNVPYPQEDVFQQHDESIYSIWMHFVLFCLRLQNLPQHVQSKKYPYLMLSEQKHDSVTNIFTRRKRLNVFVQLSEGKTVSSRFVHTNLSNSAIQKSSSSNLHPPIERILRLEDTTLEDDDREIINLYSSAFSNKNRTPTFQLGNSPKSLCNSHSPTSVLAIDYDIDIRSYL